VRSRDVASACADLRRGASKSGRVGPVPAQARHPISFVQFHVLSAVLSRQTSSQYHTCILMSEDFRRATDDDRLYGYPGHHCSTTSSQGPGFALRR
jgi:hypothetical protein